ncbi:MAG TPA: DPP IV N-terminal domain-containing protein [Longimicrobiales bacterium]
MRHWLLASIGVVVLATSSTAQDRLKTYPGYERYSRLAREIPGSVRLGSLQVEWIDTTHFEYTQAGKRYRYDARSLSATEIPVPTDQAQRRGGPERGRQFDSAISPDGKLKAFYRNRNLWLANAQGGDTVAVTTEGNEQARTKYGVASWVYGEELDQNTAMWWSPDNKQLAFYGFDESKVPDFYLQLDQTKLYSKPDVEAFPKPGFPNPIVDLYAYDLTTRQRVRIDVRDGKPFLNDVVGHYVYNIDWTKDGSELTLNRTNRKQNIMEHAACSPATGKCRVLIREEWPTGWVENTPDKKYLADGRRFIWTSERTGFRNLYLYDLTGKLLTTLTKHPFEVGQVVHVDEAARAVYYTARSGDNHMKMQLHRVGLDGKNDKRLTDPTLHHTVTASPGGRQFVIVSQAHDKPPVTRLIDHNGKVLAELAGSDLTKYQQLQLQSVELFTFKAADGTTDLHGLLHKPSNFDPSKKYPVLVSVYAGPATNGASEVFRTPHPYTEYGFLVVNLDSRSAAGRGKRFLDAIYQKLGTVEVDDQAAGIKALCARTYVDCSRVGIFGTSYGGYVSALALLRHPTVFHAASAHSPVTDWRQYDTIYTERYMWIPEENQAGYDAGSAMTYVDRIRGRLMLYYGTADNNVHPNHTMQLIQALQRAGKSFEVQVGPDRGHTSLSGDRMMEFFIENLVLQPKPVS